MNKRNLSVIFVFLAVCFFSASGTVLAYRLNVVYLFPGNSQISNPEVSQNFYGELKGKTQDYFIDSASDFELHISLMVPEAANRTGRYSAKIFSEAGGTENQIAGLDAGSSEWKEYYDNLGRDYYLKGPELDKQLSAGKYKIEVFSGDLTEQGDNQGKYVLVVGKKNTFDIIPSLNAVWQIPLLKETFFGTSILQFFLTPFGIAGIGIIGLFLILIALINYLSGLIHEIIKHNQAKTLLLTSDGMQMKNEITKLLQKPAYDITVVFISTAAKAETNLDYVRTDWNVMHDEMGFNVEEFDIEGKTEAQVMKELQLRDIIYVEGGNTFYLMQAMRACNFERVIRKLLKSGKVYVGASAGSIVAGRTIQTADWSGDKNISGSRNLKGLNLVPFDIFVHYKPEDAETIKSKMKNPNKRAKKLRILTDGQAILVQGKESMLIGKGESINI